MKTKIPKKVDLMLITALLLAIASVSFAAQPATDNTTSREVKKKMVEAAEAIKHYSVDQRDEAIKKAKALLDDLDARIDRLESHLNEKWDQMDQAARRKASESLAALRKQRNETAEWYGGLKHSSSKAWKDVKKGFLNSFHSLRDTFDKVRSDF
jgi:chromosome segregation ATPase